MAGVCVDIPDGVTYGSRLEEKSILHTLERSNLVCLLAGEYIRYHYNNNSLLDFLKHETTNCLILTNLRFLLIEEGSVNCNLPLRDLIQASHKKCAGLRWDRVILTRCNGEQKQVPVYKRQIAFFFTQVVNQYLQQLLLSQKMPSAHLREDSVSVSQISEHGFENEYSR